MLIDPTSGELTQIDGWQAIAWTPDGTKLLARGTANLADSELALIDPAKPDEPEILGTILGLAIYGGAWVDRPGSPTS